MNKDLELKLVKRFPVLYQNCYASPMQSCMAFGFEHGDGWFDIIWQLSLAIEDELGYTPRQQQWMLFKKKFFRIWNDFVYRLSPVVWDKRELRGAGVKGDPYHQEVVEYVYPRDQWLINLLLTVLPDRSKDMHSWIGHWQRLGLKALVRHPNTGFAVGQVKEKFGTLRYYCPGNDRIYRLIGMAETLSEVTCEDCGKRGKLRNKGGWLSTMCDAHAPVDSVAG